MDDHPPGRFGIPIKFEHMPFSAGVFMKRNALFALGILLTVVACANESHPAPTDIPNGILIDRIPADMDVIFDSVRYVLNDGACRDEKNEVAPNFINLPGCNALIYDPRGNGLASPRQLFAMDIESSTVVQITNTHCSFVLGQAVSYTRLMTLAICEDTDNDGIITDQDKGEIYLLDLPSGEMACLTCQHDLKSINNADYSPINRHVVFSAQPGTEFHNYLFSIDADANLVQITNQPDYMDFDCAWSEDGTRIAFSRLPSPWFEHPSQIWIVNADGTHQVQVTEGGPNPSHEQNHGAYPIGIDADPDFSPDGRMVVFSRLRTGQQNVPFGVYELLVMDLESKAIEILDSHSANMIPQWKSGGILINRQLGGPDTNSINPMELRQGLFRYKDGQFVELERYPYNVFPLGAYGGYWIDLER
jgi:dipeptidyl aminopeptidase/acylaminoacyl peptidase